jgi:ribosomal protein L11 methyltransferase
MRCFPALDIHVPADSSSLSDLLPAWLDDFQPLAIDETAGGWRVFFPSPALRDAAAAFLRTQVDLNAEPVDVPDEDWAGRSQASLRAIRIGRLVVAPPWDQASDADEALVIRIVPSMGFGTGHHASTRLCLRALQQVPLAGATVLDIGTGSGVLAIAAARLGASSVLAIDNDPDAIHSARENVKGNDVSETVTVAVADLADDRLPRADLVMANLTGAALMRHAPRLSTLVAPGGVLILSGILAEELERVRAAFAPGEVLSREIEEDWAALVVRPHRHLEPSNDPRTLNS